MIQKKLIALSLFFFFAPILIIPISRQFSVSLGGVTKEKKLPPLSAKTILKGTFQARFEKWFLRKVGIRGLLVKTDNQLNYTVFNQLSSSKDGKAILGKKGHLIEKIYIKRAQGALAPKIKKLRAKAKEIALLDKELAVKGINLIVLISPNKPSTYPEIIPSTYKVDPSVIAPYKPITVLEGFLTKKNVTTINIAERFSREPRESYPYLFSPTGTHWSEYGSCLAVNDLLTTLRKKHDDFTGAMNCTIDGKRKFPLPMDRDLLSVANLWIPSRLISEAPKVERTTISDSEEARPRVLFVGTSYLWALFYNLNKGNFFKHRDMYYYFKRSVPYPKGTERAMDRKDESWIERALKSDIIVLEANEAFPHRLGYGFPKAVLKYLEHNQQVTDNIL